MKLLLVLERVWLFIAALFFGIAVWEFFSEGFSSAELPLICMALSLVMNWVRRRNRKRFEKLNAGKSDSSQS
jgi:hypothetical protein